MRKRHRSSVARLAIVALSCAASAVEAASPDEPVAADAEAILKGEAAPIDYSQAVKCIPSYKIERTEPISNGYILFHMQGGALWLAQLRVPCPGITPNAHLSFVKDMGRLCEFDDVRVVYDNGFGNSATFGPRCTLPKFEPVSPEQIEMLKQQLKKPNPPPER
jgi:Family of unknown function (DUF6491)